MKAAVIGGNATGLTFAWLLSHQMEVDLYEKQDRLGDSLGKYVFSHQGRTIQLERNTTHYFPAYHNKIDALFRYLNLYTEPLAASYLYVGKNPFSAESLFFTHPHFHRVAPLSNQRIQQAMKRFIAKLLYNCKQNIYPTNLMLKQYMASLNLKGEISNIILPSLMGLLWQSSQTEMLNMPAETIVRFLHTSGLLNPNTHMRCIPAGFESYINKMLFKGRFRCYLSRPIAKITRQEGAILLRDNKGNPLNYDQVFLACRIDQIPPLLESISDEEHSILTSIQYTNVSYYLHQDETIIPQLDGRQPLFILEPYDIRRGNDCAYHINLSLMQNIDVPLYLSAQCNRPPAVEKTLLHSQWHKPQNMRTVSQAAHQLDLLQGSGGIWYCSNYQDNSTMTTGIGAALALADKMKLEIW